MTLTNFKVDLTSYLKKLAGVHAVGELWWHYDPKSKPAGVQLFSGQLLSREAYTDHWTLVYTKRTVVTEEEWQAMVAAQGFCQFYSSGDGSTTYRMPLVHSVHPKFVSALAEAGQHIKAGSPNITGNIGGMGNRFFLDSLGTYGAFQVTLPNKANMIQQTGTDLSGYQMYYRSNFDASRCSSVYRDDIDTIQPEALTMVIGEWVVGSVATIAEADAESLLASVTILESNVGALQSGVGRASAYIVETWHEGTEWYRKWSDGWIEQGGIWNTSNTTLSFNIAFSNISYTIVGSENQIDDNARAIKFNRNNATTTSIRMVGSANPIGVSWYACGY